MRDPLLERTTVLGLARSWPLPRLTRSRLRRTKRGRWRSVFAQFSLTQIKAIQAEGAHLKHRLRGHLWKQLKSEPRRPWPNRIAPRHLFGSGPGRLQGDLRHEKEPPSCTSPRLGFQLKRRGEHCCRPRHSHICPARLVRQEPLDVSLVPLSGQSGHGWTCCWFDPVANDPFETWFVL